jgi:hypothetical protein
MPKAKKRSANAAMEAESFAYLRKVTARNGHIFRRIEEEDVGVDAQIELCSEEEKPSGSLLGLQIKAGRSYMRNETETAFTCPVSLADLQYWRTHSLPLYLVVYDPHREVAYWLDVKSACDDKRVEDMLSGIAPRKFVLQKSQTFADTFFPSVVPTATGHMEQQSLYNVFLTEAFTSGLDLSLPIPPRSIYHLVRQLDAPTAGDLLHAIEPKQEEYIRKMTPKGGQTAERIKEHVKQVVHALRVRSYAAEDTGFVFFAFQDRSIRDKAAAAIESMMPTNRYLVLKGRRCMGPVLMDEMLLVAFDEWETGQEQFGKAWMSLKQTLGVTLASDYDMEFYGPEAAAIFLTPDYAFQYEFEIFLDTRHALELFDRCRMHARTPQTELDNEHLWISVGPDRVKAYYMWDQAIYCYLHCVRAIRTGGPWRGMYDWVLRMEFGVEEEEEREEFRRKAKAATCLAELPLMTERLKDEIYEGMKWGESDSADES